MATSAVSSTTSANTAAMSSSTSGTSSTSSTTSTSSANSSTSAQAASKAAAQKIVTSLSAGSGVDVNALAQNLVDAERIPRQTAIQSKIDKNNARVSGLSAMMYMLSDLKTKLSALKDKSSLSTMTATSSSTALSATAVAGAAVGSHAIQINKLATAQRMISATGFASDLTAINNGQPFQVSISKPGVVTGTAVASVSSVNLGGAPSDFGSFSIKVDGQTLNVTPQAGMVTLADVAADLQTQLQAQAGGSSVTVSVDPNVPGQLNFDAGTGHTVADATLTGSGTSTVGSQNAATVTGIKFGTTPAKDDFKSFSVVIAGTTRTITPAPAAATAADLAANIQTQLQSTDADVTVQAVDTGGGSFSLYVSSSQGRSISNPKLQTNVVDMTPPVGLSGGSGTNPAAGVTTGNSSGATISGISLGTTPSISNMKAFSVVIDGVTHKVTPGATGATGSTLTDLATDLQNQLQGQMGNADIQVTASGGSLTVSSASGKSIASPMLSAASLDGVSFATNNPTTKDFRGFGLTVGGSTNFTIVPSPTATTLDALAADVQSQLRTQDGKSDLSVTVDNGSLRFWSASGRPISNPVLLTNTYELTPAGVARAINDKKLGVTAQVVNTGSSSNPYQLVISSATGANQAFDISSTTTVGNTLGFNTLSTAGNAEIVVDGVTMSRSTNTVTDAITGVTLNLKSTTPGGISPTPAGLDIGMDTSSFKTKMTDMVSSFNDTWDLLNQVSDPKSTLATYGATLVGDSVVRTVRQQVRAMFQGNSSTPGATVSAFWQIGIKIDEKGVMSFDSTTFDTSMQTNYTDVVKSLTGNYDNLSTYSTAPSGFAGDAVRKLSKLLDTAQNGGPILSASENANTQNTKYQDDLTKLQTRMDALLTRYQKQLASMDSLVGNTNTRKASLKSTFDGMMSVYTKN